MRDERGHSCVSELLAVFLWSVGRQKREVGRGSRKNAATAVSPSFTNQKHLASFYWVHIQVNVLKQLIKWFKHSELPFAGLWGAVTLAVLKNILEGQRDRLQTGLG